MVVQIPWGYRPQLSIRHREGWWWFHNGVGCAHMAYVRFIGPPKHAAPLCSQLHPFVHHHTNWLFRQDNDLCNRAQIAQNWTEEYSTNGMTATFALYGSNPAFMGCGREACSYARYCSYKYQRAMDSYPDRVAQLNSTRCFLIICGVGATLFRARANPTWYYAPIIDFWYHLWLLVQSV